MWETTATHASLSHNLPCPHCGHEVHTFLACGDTCDCPPVVLPGMHAA